jgi:hypothetical protein
MATDPDPDLPFRWRTWIILLVTAAITWFYNASLIAFIGLPWRFPVVVGMSLATWLVLVRTFIRTRNPDRMAEP